MNKNYRNVAVKLSTKNQLDFLSDKSGLSKSKILEMLIAQIFSVSSTYEHVAFDYETSVSKSAIYIYLSGKNKLTFKTEKIYEKGN